jgi:hypothetical protein
MTSELYDLFEKKTGILVNKVIIDYIKSKEEMKKFNKKMIDTHNLPILATIPCFCEVLKAAGNFIFSEERPDHPFSETIEDLAETIENF